MSSRKKRDWHSEKARIQMDLLLKEKRRKASCADCPVLCQKYYWSPSFHCWASIRSHVGWHHNRRCQSTRVWTRSETRGTSGTKCQGKIRKRGVYVCVCVFVLVWVGGWVGVGCVIWRKMKCSESEWNTFFLINRKRGFTCPKGGP